MFPLLPFHGRELAQLYAAIGRRSAASVPVSAAPPTSLAALTLRDRRYRRPASSRSPSSCTRLLGSSRSPPPAAARRMTAVNDVHSRLNATEVADVVPVASPAAIVEALERARAAGLPVAIAGGRHAMGGQQFAQAGSCSTPGARRVPRFDRERGLIEVEAGIQWPELLAQALADRPRQGGRAEADRRRSLSSAAPSPRTCTAAGSRCQPFVGDVESLTLVGADGELRTCSRTRTRSSSRSSAAATACSGSSTR